MNHKGKYGISFLCKSLCLERSSFYYRPVGKGIDITVDKAVFGKIKKVFTKSFGIYGSRKVRAGLQDKYKLNISLRKVNKAMKYLGLSSCFPIKIKTNLPKHTSSKPMYCNLLNRQFDVDTPKTIVFGDTTYIALKGDWYYFCIIIDLFNREIIGYAYSQSPNAELALDTLKSLGQDITKVKVFHSDGGGEFCNSKVDNLLKKHGVQRSVSAPDPYRQCRRRIYL